MRARALLSSFIQRFDQSNLSTFFIICPPEDTIPLSTLLASLTSDTRYKLVSELDVCPDIRMFMAQAAGEINGWRVQQILKLAIAEVVPSEYYVTLDSDILCVSPFSFHALIRNGRALTNVETLSDYRRLYDSDFSRKEAARKLLRYKRSAALLGYTRPASLLKRFYGETPVVMHTPNVLKMSEHLNERYRRPWSHTLASEGGWTEYSLYFQFLEMTNQLPAVCELTGPNTVLDLERSVWHASCHYRQARNYDFKHFFGAGKENGIFVAIQSWLSAASWLPRDCRDANEFYKRLQQWVSKY